MPKKIPKKRPTTQTKPKGDGFTVGHPETGAYAELWISQRSDMGPDPLIELNYFEGPKTIEQVFLLQQILSETVSQYNRMKAKK